MDAVYALHVVISLLLLTIPFWPYRYLRYGVYLPLVISTVWILFNGCPLTHTQTDLQGQTFTRHFLRALTHCNVTEQEAGHILTFVYVLITVVGFQRMMLYKTEPGAFSEAR